jgi:hypothetical protein
MKSGFNRFQKHPFPFESSPPTPNHRFIKGRGESAAWARRGFSRLREQSLSIAPRFPRWNTLAGENVVDRPPWRSTTYALVRPL